MAKNVEKVVNAIFHKIEILLARGDRVELRGFGLFAVKTWPAQPGRKPKTGAKISVPEAGRPSFRTGKETHARLKRAVSVC